MSLKKTLPFLGLILVIACRCAIAADTGFYAGGAVGSSHASFDNRDFGGSGPDPSMGPPGHVFPLSILNSKRHDGSYNFFVGYNFNRTWAIEGGYSRQGRFLYVAQDVDGAKQSFDYTASSWTLAGKGTILLSDKLGLFGKLGLAVNTAKDNYSASATGLPLPLPPGTVSEPILTSFIQPGSHSKTTTAPLIGFGVEYATSEHIVIRVQYEDYGQFGGQTTTGRARVDVTSVGVSYKF